MAGKKGRSGRRPIAIEMRRRMIIDKAWGILDQGFDDPALSKKIKLDNASKLAVKDMPEKLSGQVAHIVQMPSIEKGGTKLEFNIGQVDSPEAA